MPAYVHGATHATQCSCGIANLSRWNERHLSRLHPSAKKQVSFEVTFADRVPVGVCLSDSPVQVSCRKGRNRRAAAIRPHPNLLG